MDLGQDRDQALLVDDALLGGQRGGRVGPRQVQDRAQLGQEQLVVGALGAAGVAPAVDEGGQSLGGIRVGHSVVFLLRV